MGKSKCKKDIGITSGSKKSQERMFKAELKKQSKLDFFSKSDDVNFGRELESKGLRVKEMLGDGNCLFRSIADQIEGKQERHDHYRNLVVKYIEKEKDYFKFFMEDDEDIDEYLIRMRGDAEWGGNQEIYAASQCLHSNIIIHQYGSPMLITTYEPAPGIRSSKSIHLSYHGSMHYNSVRAVNDYDNGPPSFIPLSELKQSGGTSTQNGKGLFSANITYSSI